MDNKQAAIRILKSLSKGLHMRIGDETIAMGEDGRVGCIREKEDGTQIVLGDMTIKEFFGLIEKYEVIPIVNHKKQLGD